MCVVFDEDSAVLSGSEVVMVLPRGVNSSCMYVNEIGLNCGILCRHENEFCRGLSFLVCSFHGEPAVIS